MEGAMTNRTRHSWTALWLLAFGAPCIACSGTSNKLSGGGAPDGSVGGGTAGPEGGGGTEAASPTSPGATGDDAGAGDAAASGTTDTGPADASPDAAIPGWTLTWSDEFDGPDGSQVDPTKWNHDVGGSGWGNNEEEYYTDAGQNAVVEDGYLIITATTQGASQYQCSYAPTAAGTCLYTSARLKTEGLFAQEYGRFEARVQMPTGQGLWPAVWMLGDNINTVSWPACGEIDFMETIGSDITTNHGSLHMPNGNPTGTYTLPDGGSFAGDFHVFTTEWEPGTVTFYVDDVLYETQTMAGNGGATWEFDHPFFLVMNVAVGGQWPGQPNGATQFPQTMKVDWVRVYQKNTSDL
jgi:beta-glucanase (GH16 family)